MQVSPAAAAAAVILPASDVWLAKDLAHQRLHLATVHDSSPTDLGRYA